MFQHSKIIAHRGIHDNIKVYENTLEAFQLAIEKNYTIELDVRITKDNKIVVFHDENTKRITNQDKIVENNTYQELNDQDIIHIPTIEEVLKLANGKVPLLIEIKQLNKVGRLEEQLASLLKKYKGKYAIQSFNPLVLLWFKKHYPNILRGQLSYEYKNKNIPFLKKILLKKMIFNIITKPNFISYKYNETSLKTIKKYQQKKIPVLGWTIITKEQYNKYIKYFDNLICEKFI